MMVNALIGGSILAGTAWCWTRLVAPWVKAQEVHQELLEIQRELIVPGEYLPGSLARGRETRETEGLANLAAAIAAREVGTKAGERVGVSQR